ncbi:MAG: PHP domain-containing protein, partial [Eubacteriales bacterium]|nr:PHP domain-containing protein [Eubacteriales bacterium]
MKDLHIHTKYSDGEYDEYEIIERIKNAGITEFAICDHDTIEGSKRVSDVLKSQKSDLIFHSGVELTSRVFDIFGGVNVHLLVRDYDFNEPGIAELVQEISVLRRKKIQRMADFIARIYGIRFSDAEIAEVEKQTNSVGKPHMYKLLCKYGNYDRITYYKNMDELHSEDLRLNA